jgi:hypothetical protein
MGLATIINELILWVRLGAMVPTNVKKLAPLGASLYSSILYPLFAILYSQFSIRYPQSSSL